MKMRPRLPPSLTALPSHLRLIPRAFHSTPPYRAEALINLFDTGDRPSLFVTKLNDKGFHLSDHLVVPGGLIILDGRPLLWDVDPPSSDFKGGLDAMWKGWGKDRFSVFELVVPRPEILLLGTGTTTIPAPKAIRDYISGLGIQLDVMDSRNAASTFNLLAEEGRRMAAALCPLSPVDPKSGERR